MPVLSVRLKLRAREDARLEAERLAALEAAAAEEDAKKQPTTLSYLKPLNKSVREKSLAEPPPRLLLLRKAKAKADTYHDAKRRGRAKGGRTTPSRRRTRSSTARGLFSPNNNRAVRGHSRSSQSVPGNTQQNASRRAPGHMQSTGQSALGRLKNSGDGLVWGHGKSTDQRLKKSSSSRSGQRQPARGRCSTASRSRGAGATRNWLGHVSKGRSSRVSKSSSDRRSRKGARRTISRSSSPSRSTWPAVATIVQAVAPPSRLKLRGNHQEE